MTVTFELDLPPRSPQPEFTAPPVPATGLVSGEDRRHRELLSALADLEEAVDELELPAPTVAPTVGAGPDLSVAAALLADGVREALDASSRLTAEALAEVVERLKTLSRQVIASASGTSGGGGNVTVLNDTSNPVPVTSVDTASEALALTPAVGTATPGSPFTITPSLGKALEVWYVAAMPDPDNSSFGVCTATLGATAIYGLFAYTHRQRFLGAANAALVLSSADGTFAVTVHYREVTP